MKPSHKRRNHSSGNIFGISKTNGEDTSYDLSRSSTSSSTLTGSTSNELVESTTSSEWNTSSTGTSELDNLVNKIKVAAESSQVNTCQCKFLSCLVSFLVDKLHNTSSKSSVPIMNAASKCLELISSSCGGNYWLERAILTEENSEEFKAVSLEFCKAVKLYSKDILENLEKSCTEELQEHAKHDRYEMTQKVKAMVKKLNKVLLKTSEEKHRYTLMSTLHARLSSKGHLNIISHSELQRVKTIGKGSEGTCVYHTKWLRQSVAEKTYPELPGHQKELFQASHPNVVRVFGVTPPRGGEGTSLIMELMSTSLYQVILKRQFPLGTCLDIMLQIAQGMRYLHANRILHKDLKTKNLLVKFDSTEPGMVVKVSDYGFSHRQLPTKGTKKKNVDNTCKSSRQMDTYRFAMVCCEVLTGREDKCPSYITAYLSRCCHGQNWPSFQEICDLLGLLKVLHARAEILSIPIFSDISPSELERLVYHLGEEWLLQSLLHDESVQIPLEPLKECLEKFSVVSTPTSEKISLGIGDLKANWNGAEHDFPEARSWYRTAARLGNPEAQWRLGLILERGQGVQQNTTQAFSLYKESAAKNHMNSILELARCYNSGLYTEPSSKEASRYFSIIYEMQEQQRETIDSIKELLATIRLEPYASRKLYEMSSGVKEGRMVVTGPYNQNLKVFLDVVSCEEADHCIKYNVLRLLCSLCMEDMILRKIIYIDGLPEFIRILASTHNEDVRECVLEVLWCVFERDASKVGMYQAVKCGIIPVLLRNVSCYKELLIQCLASEAGEMWLEEPETLEMIREVYPTLINSEC